MPLLSIWMEKGEGEMVCNSEIVEMVRTGDSNWLTRDGSSVVECGIEGVVASDVRSGEECGLT